MNRIGSRNTGLSLMLSVFVFTLAFAVAQPIEAATTKITLDIYKCLICDKDYYAFKGDDLGGKKVNACRENPNGGMEQLKLVRQLVNKDKSLDKCKVLPYHDFKDRRISTISVNMEEFYKKRDRIIVMQGGNSLSNTTVTTWKCFMCGMQICTLNNDNPNIRDWEQQSNYIFSLRNHAGIKKCNPKYFGHVFEAKTTQSVNSMSIAQNLDWFYFVKPH